MSRNFGVFSIVFDAESGTISIDRHEREVCLNSEEKEFIDLVYSYLSPRVDSSLLRLEKRSDNYTTLVYGEYNDFLRFRLSPRTKWLSLRLPFDVMADNMDNPLFSAQKNKNQLHWKAKFDSIEDVSLFKYFIIASCV